jgi:uncharacterized coiled-coil protein SlyX
MALFSSRKRQDPPVLAAVGEAASALPSPAQPAQQFSSAPLGASLRLVSNSSEEGEVVSVAEAPSLPAAPREEDLRGLPLGTILFRQGLVEQKDLEEALGAGMETGERLGEVLIRRDLVTQDDIGRGLAAQQGLEFLHEDELSFDAEVGALLPADEARQLGAVPVRIEGDSVLVVTPDPSARQRERLEGRLERRVTEAVVSRGVFDLLVERIATGGAEVLALAPAVVSSEPDEPVEDDLGVPTPAAEAHEMEEPAVEAVPAPVVDEAPEEAPTPAADTHETEEPAAEALLEPVAEEAPDEIPIDAADDPELRHEPEEAHMEQVWTEPEAAETSESQAESWAEPTTPEEIWGGSTAQTETEAAEPEADVEVEAQAHAESVEDQFEPQWHAESDQSFEASVSHESDDHEASVGRIDDLLSRIHQGASAFGDLRSQIDGLSETLRTTEETLAERERRIGELVSEHESDQRRIEELVGQLGEREEALHGLSNRVEELTGRLGSAEERLDEREHRLAELDATLSERMQHVDELSRQLERRDHALSSFEEKLNAIAAHFSA